jgi:hypothetical protein
MPMHETGQPMEILAAAETIGVLNDDRGRGDAGLDPDCATPDQQVLGRLERWGPPHGGREHIVRLGPTVDARGESQINAAEVSCHRR